MSSARRSTPRSAETPGPPPLGPLAICRACMAPDADMSELFPSAGDQNRVRDKVEFCTGLKITQTDDLPDRICRACLALLDSAFQFKTTCLLSDMSLRANLVKNEHTCNDATIEILSLCGVKSESGASDSAEEDCLTEQITNEDRLAEKITNEDRLSAKITNEDCLTAKVTSKKRTNKDRIAARTLKTASAMSSRKTVRRIADIRKKRQSKLVLVKTPRAGAPIKGRPVRLEREPSDDSDDLLRDVKVRKGGQETIESCDKLRNAEPAKLARLLTRSRPLWCEACQLKFPDKAALLKHRKHHHADETALSFVCEICGKTFRHRSSYYYHQQSHLPPKFPCQQCDYVTWHKHDLEKHQRTHTGVKQYQCDLCPCAYHVSSNLRSHIRRVHERRKDHTCPICQHKFFDKRKMNQHIDSHNDVKRYSCEICGTGLSRRYYWTRHMLRQHGVVVEKPRPGRHKTNMVVAEKKPSEEL